MKFRIISYVRVPPEDIDDEILYDSYLEAVREVEHLNILHAGDVMFDVVEVIG